VGTKNIEPSSNKSAFVDCGKTINVEDIKEVIWEEKSVDCNLTFHQEICEDIKKEEIIEEKNVEVPSFDQQQIGNVSLDYSFF
jgi:hypothetical protein